MIWLVWRRQRAALLFALGLVAAVAVFMVLAGTWSRGAGDRLAVPGPPSVVLVVRTILLVLPGLVGVIVGAGLFGRELEHGTHVFALTQAVGRLRWWLTGLIVTGLPVALAVALVTWLAGWALGPRGLYFPLGTPFFDSSGLVPVGHVLLAFTITAVAGLVLRNALAAVAVGVGVMLVAQIVLAAGFRQHYLPPETARMDVAAVDSTEIIRSRVLDQGYLDVAGRAIASPGPAGCIGPGDQAPCLRSAGITTIDLVYQPASRYWPFQWIEVAVLLALCAAALGVGYWGLRRKVS